MERGEARHHPPPSPDVRESLDELKALHLRAEVDELRARKRELQAELGALDLHSQASRNRVEQIRAQIGEINQELIRADNKAEGAETKVGLRELGKAAVREQEERRRREAELDAA